MRCIYLLLIEILAITCTTTEARKSTIHSINRPIQTDAEQSEEENEDIFPWHSLTEDKVIDNTKQRLTHRAKKISKHTNQGGDKSKLLNLLHKTIDEQKFEKSKPSHVSKTDQKTEQTLQTTDEHIKLNDSKTQTSKRPILQARETDHQISVNNTLDISNHRISEWKYLFLDPKLWIGTIAGSVFSILSIIVGFVIYYIIQKNRRRNYCVDLNNLSLCSLGNQKNKDPVYVRLSQLHNPRKDKQDSQYIISMNQSNNFSICTDSESSSTEEEIFNASDAKIRQSAKQSTSKISMTSTPVKASHHSQEDIRSPMRIHRIPFVGSPFASPIVKRDNNED